MLEFILELTTEIISRANSLTRKEKKLVYEEVNYALNQTRTHIVNTRQGSMDKACSQLSNIWRRVGNRLRQINNEDIQNLAKTIDQKSKYWSDPINYDLKNIDHYEMRLSQVEQKLKQIS